MKSKHDYMVSVKRSQIFYSVDLERNNFVQNVINISLEFKKRFLCEVDFMKII